MKRILIISRNFPPLEGGMERLNLHLVEECAKQFDIHLIAPKGASQYVSQSVDTFEVPVRSLARFFLTSGWLAVRQAIAWRPQLVVAGSGLTAPLALLAAWLCGARSCAYVHGLDLTVPHVIYRTFWPPVIRRLNGIIANSRATAGVAAGIGVAPRHISVIAPGVRLPEPDPGARSRFRAAYALQGNTVLLSVGRLAARKGLREFVREVLPAIVDRHSDIMLVVVGTTPSNALYAKAQTPESIQAAADSAGVGKNVLFLGNINDSSLHDAYAGADLHVFPVRHIPDDPEGFGMVAVEAAAHGLETIAYACGGVVDAVSDGRSGRLVNPGNAAAFASAVLSSLDDPLPEEGVRAFAAQFSWEHFGGRIRVVLDGLHNEGEK